MQARIAIVEDETAQYEYVAKMIEAYAKNAEQHVMITYVANAEEFLFKYDQPGCFDIIFLDVMMKEMNGMELAKAIRQFDRAVQLVFLTGVADYVFEGYEAGAVRYLIKPVNEEKLADTLNACFARLSERRNDYLTFRYMGETVRVAMSDIISIEINGHYVSMKTCKTAYEWKESLARLLKMLDRSRFVNANRSTVVNIEYINKITREECFLDSGEVIPVSRGAYVALNEAFMSFYMKQNKE